MNGRAREGNIHSRPVLMSRTCEINEISELLIALIPVGIFKEDKRQNLRDDSRQRQFHTYHFMFENGKLINERADMVCNN